MNSTSRRIHPERVRLQEATSRRIHLISDSSDRSLGKEGFELESARDGLEGLEKLKKMKTLPDLITLDLLMPKMNGYEFMEARNKFSNLKPIPIVVVTNLNLPEEQQRAKKLGAVEYIVKSAQEPHEIVASIKNILSKK